MFLAEEGLRENAGFPAVSLPADSGTGANTPSVCVRETAIRPSHMIPGPCEEYQIRPPRCIVESHDEHSDFGTVDPNK